MYVISTDGAIITDYNMPHNSCCMEILNLTEHNNQTII